MLFENLKVARIAVHEIYQRTDDRAIREPAFASVLEELSADAMGAFRLRLTDALSGQSQSIQMRIARFGSDSIIHVAEHLINTANNTFLNGSKQVAIKLAEAQISRRIPGGMLIVFDGSVGSPSVPFVGIIKAETQAGFRRSNQGSKAVLEFLENIFLTPATRLYKIGMLLFDNRMASAPEGRRAFVFDSNISQSNREGAAAYFYEAFLGCALPSDGPYETLKFFDLTKEFIRKADIPTEKKRDIIDSLYVFVRDDQDPTFTADQFGSRFMPAEHRDTYANFLDTKKFTSGAVVRDISQMGTRLRRRRLKFGGDIELSASPEAMKHKIDIKAIEGPETDGVRPQWTQITIRGTMTDEQ